MSFTASLIPIKHNLTEEKQFK